MFGFTKDQVQEFKTRSNKNQRKTASRISIKPKGRPRKDGTQLLPPIQQLGKLTQLQYELAMKERHIKRLEMENELMRDFLSLTENVRTSVKYMVIYRHKDKYSISEMYRFFSVSRSGYYVYVSRMDIHAKDISLAEKIQECQERCGRTCGYRRFHIWLERNGIYRNPKTILRVMRKLVCS